MIAGIDYSLTNCGIVTYEPETKKFSAYIIKSKERGIERIVEIARRASAILSNVSELMIEGYAGINNVTLPPRCEGIGALMYELRLSNRPKIYEIPPQSMKLHVSGYGQANMEAREKFNISFTMDQEKANKEIVKRALQEKLGFCYPTTDTNDALGLCLILSCLLGFRNEIDINQKCKRNLTIHEKLYINQIGNPRSKHNLGKE